MAAWLYKSLHRGEAWETWASQVLAGSDTTWCGESKGVPTMTDQTTPTASGSPEPVTPRRRRRWLFVTTVALLAAFSGAMATRAIGQYGPPGWGHMQGGPWFMRGPLNATEIEDRLDRAVRHAA